MNIENIYIQHNEQRKDLRLLEYIGVDAKVAMAIFFMNKKYIYRMK